MRNACRVFLCLGAVFVAISVCMSAVSVAQTQTFVSLTFDDTSEEHVTMASMLEAHGMVGTFYINSPRIGVPGFMTVEELRAIEAAGHEIAGHTLNHLNLTTLTPEEQKTEVCEDRAALLELGFAVSSFAYPFGASTPEVEDVVEECGYTTGRDVGGLQTQTSCSNCPAAESIPPLNIFLTRTGISVNTSHTIEDLIFQVENAENSGGGWVTLLFHRLCKGEDCPRLSVDPDVLEEFLTWLEQRSAIGTFVGRVDEIVSGTFSFCGDEVCREPKENCSICPEDCGVCVPQVPLFSTVQMVVQSKRDDHSRDDILFQAEIDVERPMSTEILRVAIDGKEIVSVPVDGMSTEEDEGDQIVMQTKDVKVKLDFRKGTMEVRAKRVDQEDTFDNSDGVLVDVEFGSMVGQEIIVLTRKNKKKLVYP